VTVVPSDDDFQALAEGGDRSEPSPDDGPSRPPARNAAEYVQKEGPHED
jgi:hypothetical protein